MAISNPIFDVPFPDVARQQSFIRQNINGPVESFLGLFGNNYNDVYCNGFDIVVDNQYDVLGSGQPDYANRPIQYLHQTLSNFCTANPPSSKWAVFIEPKNSKYLLSQISDMKQYEPWGSSLDWDFKNTAGYLMSPDTQQRIGCIFALGVNEAGVSVGVGKFGGVNGVINGFTKGSATQGRGDNGDLEMVFRETNCSYVDHVLRPWTMLVGHKGLHAREQSESIKADITIFEMAGTFPDRRPIIRKVFKYYECVPINVAGETLSYESDKLVQRQVGFTYGYFTIQDGSGLNDDTNFNRSNMNDSIVEENVFGVVNEDK